MVPRSKAGAKVTVLARVAGSGKALNHLLKLGCRHEDVDISHRSKLRAGI